MSKIDFIKGKIDGLKLALAIYDNLDIPCPETAIKDEIKEWQKEINLLDFPVLQPGQMNEDLDKEG